MRAMRMTGTRLRKEEYWSMCGLCGRQGLQRNHKSTATFLFHYAPCGRPCAGGSLKKLDSEDMAGGVHRDRQCMSCKAKAVNA